MKRTTLLLILLVAIVGTVLYFARQQSNTSNAAEEYIGNFAVTNIDDIGKIVLTHRAGPAYTLSREHNGWMINGRYPVRMSSLTPLLDAIRQVHIRYIPSDAAIPNVVENIEGTYVHVEIIDRQGERMKAYRVGGVTQDERGTYVLMDGASQPFVVHIPAWDGALRARFTLSLDDWRDRKFMGLRPEEIVTVTVNYPRQQSQSFRLERSTLGFDMEPLFPEMRSTTGAYRKGTGEAFLNALAGAACEGYENGYPLKDSIRAMVPFCEMLIGTRNAQEDIAVRIWPKGTPVYTQYSPPVHRLFIERTPGDFVLAQFEVVKGMLRGYDFFTGQETQLIF